MTDFAAPVLESEFMALTQDLDTAAFWEENSRCRIPTTEKPRCFASLWPDDLWAVDLSLASSYVRYYHDKLYRDALHRHVNCITQAYVGQSFFDEDTWQYSPRRIEELFGCTLEIREGSTPWLLPATDDPREFSRILDRVESIDLDHWVFPDEYLAEWEDRRRAGRSLPKLGTWGRGPAMVMTSALKPETALLWCFDYPDLMRRFRDLMMAKMVAHVQVLRKHSGNSSPGYAVLEDNCALFNAKLYREYIYPVLMRLMDTQAPGDAMRYQHSDSAMAHLIDLQRELGINEVNYGPEIDVGLIRAKMPDAVIRGHIPPFLLRNGGPQEIKQRLIDDFHKAGHGGRLHVMTAGVLAAGTSIGRMRWFMEVVQEHCRYDRESPTEYPT